MAKQAIMEFKFENFGETDFGELVLKKDEDSDLLKTQAVVWANNPYGSQNLILCLFEEAYTIEAHSWVDWKGDCFDEDEEEVPARWVAYRHGNDEVFCYLTEEEGEICQEFIRRKMKEKYPKEVVEEFL